MVAVLVGVVVVVALLMALVAAHKEVVLDFLQKMKIVRAVGVSVAVMKKTAITMVVMVVEAMVVRTQQRPGQSVKALGYTGAPSFAQRVRLLCPPLCGF